MIATDVQYMRAIDYRAQNLGITLIIAKSFEHERQAQQGLGRVGRNGDACLRVLLRSVPLIDANLRFQYFKKMNVFFNDNIAKIFKKKDNNSK